MKRLTITKNDGTAVVITADTWRYDTCGFLTFSMESGSVVLSIRPEYVVSIEPVEEPNVPQAKAA